MTTTRRLAAILAADVAGYSRLIGDHEEGTLNRLRSIRADVIDPKISEHRGRIVKTTGDGLLVEFTSVVDALRCATEIQSTMAERNADIAAEKRARVVPPCRHWRSLSEAQSSPQPDSRFAISRTLVSYSTVCSNRAADPSPFSMKWRPIVSGPFSSIEQGICFSPKSNI